MPALVDTNVLVYRHDARFPGKQAAATRRLREGVESGELVLPHQAIVEFVAAVTRPRPTGGPLLEPSEAWREAEEMLRLYTVLFPTADVVRLALRGAATYGLSWFDAHLWAYAEHFGCETLLSEDFQDGRTYGRVRIENPFA